MLQSLVAQIGAGAIVAVCGYALAVGTWRERFGAVIYLTAYLISFGLGLGSVEHAPWYLLIADILCLFGFYIACWKSTHPWPQWALFGQVVSVLVSLIAVSNTGIPLWTFLTVQIIAGWGVLLALLVGTIAVAETRRQARKLSRRK